MESEDLGGNFVVAVEELGISGLWTTIKDLLEARTPLQGLMLSNKFGKPSQVAKLPLTYVLASDKRLQRLRPFSHSPVTWFRNPYVHVILVSTADVNEYKSITRAAVKKATLDIERDWGSPGVSSEWLILYVRPFELDIQDKGARKVYERLRDDFGSKRRERVVRLDVPLRAFDLASTRARAAAAAAAAAGGAGAPPAAVAGVAGLEEWDAALRDALRAGFETRQAGYDAEVRKLLNERREPSWSFTTLYLVKDSFALMLEAAGMWEDAFQEYVELETCYLDTLEATGTSTIAPSATAPASTTTAAAATHGGGGGGSTGGAGGSGGGAPPGAGRGGAAAAEFGVSDSDDVAALLTTSWRSMRRAVLKRNGVPEFHFRQYLFAAQARVLLHLGRPLDVAERGLVFVQNFLQLLAGWEASGALRPWFKECWAFSACMSLAQAVTAYTLRRHLLPPDWEVSDLLAPSPNAPTAQQITAWRAAGAAAAAGAASSIDSVSSSSSSAGGGGGGGGGGAAAAAAGGAAAPASWELGLDPRDLGPPPPLEPSLLAGEAISPAAVEAAAGGSGGTRGGLLGASSSYLGSTGDLGGRRGGAADRLLHCLLGHLYSLARGELLRMGQALALETAHSPKAVTAAAAAAAVAAGGGPQKAASGGGGSGAAGGYGAGWELVSKAVAGGALSPVWASHLQELMASPLCGFSRTVTKCADGRGNTLAYEPTTPKRPPEEDPLSDALRRSDSQSVPRQTGGSVGGAGQTALSSMGSAGPPPGSPAASTAAPPGSLAGALYDRIRRSAGSGSLQGAGSVSGGDNGSVAGGGIVTSRLGRTTGEGGGGGGSDVEFEGADGGLEVEELESFGEGVGPIHSEALSTVNIASPLPDIRGVSVIASDSDGGAAAAVGSPLRSGVATSAFGSGVGGATVGVLAALDLAGTPGPAPLASPRGDAAAGHTRSASEVPGGAPMPSPRLVEGAIDMPASPAPSAAATAAPSQHPQPPPHPRSGGAFAAAVVPPPSPSRVGDWRLAAALSGAGLFGSLVLDLCTLTAWCYSKAGRVRTSALVYADMATMLLRQGRMAEACELYDRLVTVVTTEGWPLLSGKLLPALIACQRLSPDAVAALPLSCLRLLSLPQGAAREVDRAAALSELEAAAGSGGDKASAAASAAISSVDVDTQLQALAAIRFAPVKGTCSLYYGSAPPPPPPAADTGAAAAAAPAGPPLLSPPPSASSGAAGAPAARGAALVRAGDAVRLEVDVFSNLPGPVLLRAPELVLTRLPLNPTQGPRGPWGGAGPGGAGTGGPLASLDGASLETPRGGSLAARWQEPEEPLCARLRTVQSSPESGSLESGCQEGSSRLEGRGDLRLCPGSTRLVFEAAPAREGLYALRHVRALLGSVELLLQPQPAAERPPPFGPEGFPLLASPQLPPGCLVPEAGAIAAELVVACVAPPAPRLAAAAVAPGGALRCGQPQWLGLLLAPLHGAPAARARLRLLPGRHLVLLGDPSEAPAAVDLLASGGSIQSREQVVPAVQQVCAHSLSADAQPSGAAETGTAAGSSKGNAEADAAGAGDQGGRGGAGEWLVMERGCMELSRPLQRPLLLWLQTLVGTPSGEPAAVRVAPAASAARGGVGSSIGGAPGAPGAAGSGGAGPFDGGRWRAPWAALEVQLEYFDGMWRSHSSCLEVPLRQPLSATLRAQQLPPSRDDPDSCIALHLALQSDSACGVTVREIQISPQLGLQVHPAFPAPPDWLLPLELEAGGTAGVTFVLQRARGASAGGGFAGDVSSSITVVYALEDGPEAAAAAPTVCDQPGGPPPDLLPDLQPGAAPAGLPAPPAALPAATGSSGDVAAAAAARAQQLAAARGAGGGSFGGGGGGGGGLPRTPTRRVSTPCLREGEALLRLPFVLEVDTPQRGPTRQPHVRVRLLGPGSIPAGGAAALTWQITRVADAPAAGGAAAGTAPPGSQQQQQQQEGEGEEELLWYELHFSGSGLAPFAAAGGGSSGIGRGGEPLTAGGSSNGGGGQAAAAAKLHGSVRLGRAAGSMATVEAGVVPLGMGLQEAPRLVLLGLPEAEQERAGADAVFVYATA